MRDEPCSILWKESGSAKGLLRNGRNEAIPKHMKHSIIPMKQSCSMNGENRVSVGLGRRRGEERGREEDKGNGSVGL